MANSFLTQLALVKRALQEGLEEISPDISIDTRNSSSVAEAFYQVPAEELVIHFRNRRRKFYFYPMNGANAAAFALAGSKGRWLRQRTVRTVGRDPRSGRFGQNPRRKG